MSLQASERRGGAAAPPRCREMLKDAAKLGEGAPRVQAVGRRNYSASGNLVREWWLTIADHVHLHVIGPCFVCCFVFFLFFSLFLFSQRPWRDESGL